MSIKPKFYGKVTNGLIEHVDSDAFKRHVSMYPDGTEVEITIGRRYRRRTQGLPGEDTNFNGYYWGVIVRMVADEMGELDNDFIHNMLQMLFNRKGISTVDPDTKMRVNIEVPRGTKYLSGGEFSEYCSRIRTWASIPGNICERGLYIPEPHEVEMDS